MVITLIHELCWRGGGVGVASMRAAAAWPAPWCWRTATALPAGAGASVIGRPGHRMFRNNVNTLATRPSPR